MTARSHITKRSAARVDSSTHAPASGVVARKQRDDGVVVQEFGVQQRVVGRLEWAGEADVDAAVDQRGHLDGGACISKERELDGRVEVFDSRG